MDVCTAGQIVMLATDDACYSTHGFSMLEFSLRPELQAISNCQCCPRLFGNRFFGGFPDRRVGGPERWRAGGGAVGVGEGEHRRTVPLDGPRGLGEGGRQKRAITGLVKPPKSPEAAQRARTA